MGSYISLLLPMRMDAYAMEGPPVISRTDNWADEAESLSRCVHGALMSYYPVFRHKTETRVEGEVIRRN